VKGRCRISVLVLAAAALLLWGALPGFSQEERRGLSVLVRDPEGKPAEVKLYDQVMALVIGIDTYKNLPPSQWLKYGVSDAKAVAELLRSEFEMARVDTLFNELATKEGIQAKFLELNRSLGKNDGLFVFVASHGTTVGDVGFIVPHDGSFEESEAYRNISMAELKDVIGKLLNAKHVFFVIDACYSGSILEKRGREGKADWSLEYVKELTREPVRYALTAGDKGQQVLDGGPKGRSVFTGRFLEALEEAQNYITATELSEKIARKVYSDARDRGHVQTPQYGSLSGLGNFVFLKKGARSLADLEGELAALEKELESLKSRIEGARSREEKARLELELQRRQAEEGAKRLEQEALASAEEKRAEELRRERRIQEELERNQATAQEELQKIRQANEEKRRLLEELGKVGGSYAATVTLLGETEAAIADISRGIEASRAKTLQRIKEFYAAKYAEVEKLAPDPWEKKAEFQDRKRALLETYRRNEYDETAEARARYDAELAAQTGDLKARVERYRASVFVLTGAELLIELGAFDPEAEQFPLAVKSLSGEVPFARTFAFSIASRDARERKEKYQKVVSTYGAKGYAGELAFGLPSPQAQAAKAKAGKTPPPLVYGFRLLDLTEANRECFRWINPEAKGRLPALSVRANFAGAAVFVNGEERGSTGSEGSLEVADLFPGTYKIEARAEGYEPAAAEAAVATGQPVVVNLVLKPSGPTLVRVQGGAFRMGSTDGESDERPVHEVRVSDFSIGKYEVTFEEYDAFCVATGRGRPADNGWGRGKRPVINVSLYDAVAYCNWLSEQVGLRPCYALSGTSVQADFRADGYRLPTEAEWEYAARGGVLSRGYRYAGGDRLVEVAWYGGNSGGRTQPVGTKATNELGLHDMSGNVWEWCWDWHGSYPSSLAVDPTGPLSGRYRVLRGGSWFFNEYFCRAATRVNVVPVKRDFYVGFRVARRIQE
jgi:formylglycine-generating enzyme required for sulfatase activity/uncharacterized caspase-like protein